MTALLALFSTTLNHSSASISVSPTTVSVIMAMLWPAVKFTVPLVAPLKSVASAPLIAYMPGSASDQSTEDAPLVSPSRTRVRTRSADPEFGSESFE